MVRLTLALILLATTTVTAGDFWSPSPPGTPFYAVPPTQRIAPAPPVSTPWVWGRGYIPQANGLAAQALRQPELPGVALEPALQDINRRARYGYRDEVLRFEDLNSPQATTTLRGLRRQGFNITVEPDHLQRAGRFRIRW